MAVVHNQPHLHLDSSERVNPRYWPLEARILTVVSTIFLTFHFLHPLFAILISGFVFTRLILDPAETRYPSLVYSVFHQSPVCSPAATSSPSFHFWNWNWGSSSSEPRRSSWSWPSWGRSYSPPASRPSSWSWSSPARPTRASNAPSRWFTPSSRQTDSSRSRPSRGSSHLSTSSGETRRRVKTPVPKPSTRSRMSSATGRTRRR